MIARENQLDLDGLDELLNATGHCLVLGGPGAGKTTAALAKANLAIQDESWDDFRQVLFLSFARSTVARIGEAATSLITEKSSGRIELTTYHSFIWRLIRSHGYLYCNKKLRLLPPHEAACRLANACSGLDKSEFKNARESECRRLLSEEGLLNFDLFAEVASDILENSDRLCRVISNRHPIIFLDEFQDTNLSEYRFVKCLAKYSSIVALADPDQRIYEFRGADPKRIPDFVADFGPSTFDLAKRNHRSHGTDILDFANDLLTKTASEFVYDDVKIKTFPTRTGPTQHIWMKTKALKAIKRSAQRVQEWSVAILVPTKSLMLTVSDYLATEQHVGERKLPKLAHDVAVDAEGPSLAGVTIGRLLECQSQTFETALDHLISDVCTHIVGRKGGRPPSQTEVQLIEGVEKFFADRKVRGSKRQLVIDECKRIVESTNQFEFTGDPFVDWIAIRNLFDESTSPVVKCLGTDAKYLRFLRKGTTLRSRLSELWRKNKSYEGSMACVKSAFIQEHFIAKRQKPKGLYVMTIHKSKGKEFDEVLIYEGVHRDRIVRDVDSETGVAQAILSLRVAVSRARHRVTLLTPQASRCPLF